MRRVANPDWRTVYADVDILYGGLWIRDYGDYADVIELTDLDSATGTTNMVMVSIGSVGLYASTFAENRKRVVEARESSGYPGARRSNRLEAWASLWSYGYRDINSEAIIATAEDWSGGRDGWKPTEHSYGVDGQCGKWLAKVNGAKGLKRWLWRYQQLDTDAAQS